jgi:hypothetical protein
VAVADEDLVGLLDVLVDKGLFDLDGRVRVELAGEKPGVETTKPGVDEDGFVGERDLPPVGAEPLEVDSGRTRPAAPGCCLRALGDPGEQQGFRPVDGRGRDSGREPGAQELAP